MPKASATKQSRTDVSTAPAAKRSRKNVKSTELSAEADSGEDIQEQIRTGEITLQNQKNSPLLRLPTELRELIWMYAFGARTVHPTTSRSYMGKSVGDISFYACRERFSDQAIYNLTLKGASKHDEYKWKSRRLYNGRSPRRPMKVFAGVHYCTNEVGEEPEGLVQFGVPAACKQMYYEAVPIMWKTTIFCFTESTSFEDFVKTKCIRKDLIEQLTIVPGGYRNGWNTALTPHAVGAFTNLQGLHLVIITDSWSGGYTMFDPPETRPYHQLPPHFRHIMNLITQFQALPLKKERTTVWVTGSWTSTISIVNYGVGLPPHREEKWFRVEERREVAEGIRGMLLDYKPRRRGGRRGGGVGRSEELLREP